MEIVMPHFTAGTKPVLITARKCHYILIDHHRQLPKTLQKSGTAVRGEARQPASPPNCWRKSKGVMNIKGKTRALKVSKTMKEPMCRNPVKSPETKQKTSNTWAHVLLQDSYPLPGLHV